MNIRFEARVSDLISDVDRTESALNPELIDRVSALEARLSAQGTRDRSQFTRSMLLGLVALVGTALAGAAVVLTSAAIAVGSAACVLVLFGCGRRSLAIANGVVTTGALLAVLIFVPALHEMNRQAVEARNSLVATITSSGEFGVSAPVFPTFEGIDLLTTPPAFEIENELDVSQ